MDNLNTNGITETTIFTMNPDHAAENIKDNEIIARASRLDNFDDDSDFDAGLCDVYVHYALRGVLNPTEGVAKISTLTLDERLKILNASGINTEELRKAISVYTLIKQHPK